MIIWVFRLKTREERGGGLPKGERGGCLRAFWVPDRALQSRDHWFGVSTKKVMKFVKFWGMTKKVVKVGVSTKKVMKFVKFS